MEVLGIDIGGSGIKGAVVCVERGEIMTERFRLPTPHPCTPTALMGCLRQMIQQFQWKGPVGVGFPGVIRNNVIQTAVNLHPDLVSRDFSGQISRITGQPCVFLNDADAAGLAEIAQGTGKGVGGVVLLLTIGTGIGSALFVDGKLVPNSELGHIELHGADAEKQVSERARVDQGLSWSRWAKRFEGYLRHLEFILQPDMIILGGGGAKKHEKFFELLEIKTPLVIARYRNKAGIIGAAFAAAHVVRPSLKPASKPFKSNPSAAASPSSSSGSRPRKSRGASSSGGQRRV